MQETWVRSLGEEDPLEKEMATHSSTLAWKIPWMEKPCRLQSMGSQRVGHEWAISLSLFFYVFTWLDHLFFLVLNNILFSECTSLLTHTPAKEHLGCFYFIVLCADIEGFFYKLKIYSNPESSKSVVPFFQQHFSHFVSVYPILLILTVL